MEDKLILKKNNVQMCLIIGEPQNSTQLELSGNPNTPLLINRCSYEASKDLGMY